MSPCLSGGAAFNLTLDVMKPYTSSWASCSSPSSSCSALSESSHSSISTRKARTRRKRPNQAYNEAASILSTAFPKLFTAKHLPRPESTKSLDKRSPFLIEPSDLVMPRNYIENSAYLLQAMERPDFHIKSKNANSIENPPRVPAEFDFSEKGCEEQEGHFSKQQILDEEIGEGIDCVMGKLSMDNEKIEDLSDHAGLRLSGGCCYGYPVGLGFDLGIAMRNEFRAMRNVHGGENWWRFQTVDLADLTQKIADIPVEKTATKKKKNLGSGKRNKTKSDRTDLDEWNFGRVRGELLLKLNYDSVLRAWSDRGSPFCDEWPAVKLAGGDVRARLAQRIELNPLTDDGAGNNATVQRVQEKRPSHLLPKKIRCQVRKVKANQRPRLKGEFCKNGSRQ